MSTIRKFPASIENSDEKQNSLPLLVTRKYLKRKHHFKLNEIVYYSTLRFHESDFECLTGLPCFITSYSPNTRTEGPNKGGKKERPWFILNVKYDENF